MIRIICILTLAFLSFNINTVSAQKAPLSTRWQTAKYDSIEYLSNMDFLYESDEKLLYLLTNDEENLYIHLRTINELPERKIIDFGFSVELKIKGDKTKRIIEYPLAKDERAKPVILIQNNSEERRQNFNLIKDQIVKQIYAMRLTGFTDEVSIVKASENLFKIKGNMIFNKKGQLQYLLTIPIESLGFSLQDNFSMNVILKSGSLEAEAIQGPPPNGQQDMNAGQAGQNQQGRMGQPGMGQQGMPQQGLPQGNRNTQQANLGVSMQQRSVERGPMSTPINIKLKNLVLLKKAGSF